MTTSTVQSSPPSSWIGRNWKWFAPLGCLTILFVFLAFAVAIISVVGAAMKSSEPYQTAVALAQRDRAVRELLGDPVKTGWMTRGDLQLENEQGRADLSIPLKGSKRDGTLDVVGEKRGGHWSYSKIRLNVPGMTPVDLRQ